MQARLIPIQALKRSPYELGLGWLVNLDAADFVGKRALKSEQQAGSKFQLRSFEIDNPNQPEDGTTLFANIDGQQVSIGQINCSGWSWDLGKMIGNASVKSRYAATDNARAMVEGAELEVRLSRGPLRKFDRSKQVPAPTHV